FVASIVHGCVLLACDGAVGQVWRTADTTKHTGRRCCPGIPMRPCCRPWTWNAWLTVRGPRVGVVDTEPLQGLAQPTPTRVPTTANPRRSRQLGHAAGRTGVSVRGSPLLPAASAPASCLCGGVDQDPGGNPYPLRVSDLKFLPRGGSTGPVKRGDVLD